jgi:O-antigen/teichoic acid export membrane protein
VTWFTMLQQVAAPALRVLLVLAVTGLSGILVSWALPLGAVLIAAAVIVGRALARHSPSKDALLATATPADDVPDNRAFWSFSAGRGVASVFEILLEWLDVLVVTAVLGPAEGGVYGVVTRLIRVGLVMDTAVRIAIAPKVARLLDVGDTARVSELFTAMARVVILVAWPAYLGLAVFGHTVLGWFGSDFTRGWRELAVVSLVMMVVMAAGIVQSLLLMGGRSGYQMVNKAVAVGVNVSLNLVLLPVLGLPGAALAWAVSRVVDTGLAAWQVRYRLHVVLRWCELLLPALLALVVVGLGAIVVMGLVGQSGLGLVVAVVVLGAVYAAAVAVLRHRLRVRDLLVL